MLSNDNKSKTFNDAIKYEMSIAENKVDRAPLVIDNEVKVASKSEIVRHEERGLFFVQVGAFSDYAKAKEMANNMKRFGNVSIYEAYLSKDGVYRVRLGAYNSRSEAEKILDRVLDYGHADVSIVKG